MRRPASVEANADCVFHWCGERASFLSRILCALETLDLKILSWIELAGPLTIGFKTCSYTVYLSNSTLF